MIIKRAAFVVMLLVITILVITNTNQKYEDELLAPISDNPIAQNHTFNVQEEAEEFTGEIGDFEIIKRAIVLVHTEEGAGSGFVISDDMVLTAYHVVEGYVEVEVWFPNGARRTGFVQAVNTELDIAIIRVPRIPRSVQPLELEFSSTPELGAVVWAWGYPFADKIAEAGFDRTPTVTAGIISAHRKQMGVMIDSIHFLQTDAALNSGNSGGPLITEDGKVVGINIKILIPEGKDPEGLNFAIDITKHQKEIERLLDTD